MLIQAFLVKFSQTNTSTAEMYNCSCSLQMYFTVMTKYTVLFLFLTLKHNLHPLHRFEPKILLLLLIMLTSFELFSRLAALMISQGFFLFLFSPVTTNIEFFVSCHCRLWACSLGD